MAENKNVTRREFIGTTAAAGTVLVTGSHATSKAAGQADEMVYYVGYGSNLEVAPTLEDLLPNGKYLMRAYIPNYEIQFRRWSNNYRGGISGIVEVPGEMVECAMYQCPSSDLEHLDYRIDYYVPDYYRQLFKVLGEDNKWYDAHLYRLYHLNGPFPPSRRYVEGMLKGAKEIKLSPDYIKKIEGHLARSIVAPE
jgi:hypothetical protein